MLLDEQEAKVNLFLRTRLSSSSRNKRSCCNLLWIDNKTRKYWWKKLASNSFQHSSHISVCAPWWWEGRAGQWMVLILQSNYNNIPHADGCVLPALPFYLWLSLQQVQVFSYLATVVMGHGFSRRDDGESAVSSRVVAAATSSPFETRTQSPGFYSTHREQSACDPDLLTFMSSEQMKRRLSLLFSEQMQVLYFTQYENIYNIGNSKGFVRVVQLKHLTLMWMTDDGCS